MIFWTHLWLRVLIAVLTMILVPELISIVVADITHQRHLVDFTLSDTIRRWSLEYAWLKYAATGVTLGLLWHFFAQVNPQ